MRKPTTENPDKRDAYHHGDLRRTLLEAARNEISANGAQSLSLASLARRAGVAQSAPYRHFADRDELLAGVATHEFEAFTEALLAAAAAGPEAGAVKRICAAYLCFGEENVQLYRLMFASGLVAGAPKESELLKAALASFRPLLDRVSDTSPRRARAAANAIWAQLHGFVMLKADGLLTEPSEELLEGLMI
ncbi:TetR/AcrR family transcriptional regulator [Bosea caraganae]|uniref:TetR/AcrR family transcriptional regulator n=1 Tax=Bosea caraganae TaxID=2763117 RepID=A0A370L478_9HYPH|nr:TetR/AcrR family transcriptional regulator [Bosea caraganae]RDJ23642.1 TetR/AcrR family transcriptional regulator [Bosea caraganae]RDJ24458.1 TetR/AcrR family transcriptional regulator [Bosea caraganae]